MRNNIQYKHRPLLAAFIIVWLTGCVAPKPIESTITITKNASDYTKYYWAEHTQKSFIPELENTFVQQTDKTLREKGYELVAERQADVRLTYEIGAKNTAADVTKIREFEDYGPGLTCGAGGCESTNEREQFSHRSVHIEAEGTIVLRAHSVRTDQEIWNVRSTKAMSFDFDPDVIERPENIARESRHVAQMVRTMLTPVPSATNRE
ncbi:MAG: hypothetical protein AAGJ37_08725 [Pseudomonadota bacterium]